MSRKFLTFFIFISVFFIFFATGLYVWWNKNSKPVSANTYQVDFLITKGKSASQIAQELYDKGLIRSPFAFKIYIQVKGYSDRIQAGRYSIPQNLTITEIAELLVKGPKDLWVTIPEGLRREEVVEKFIEGLKKEGEEAELFRKEFLKESEGLEGFLFPDTYLFPKDVQAKIVVSMMKNTFDKRLTEIGGIGKSKLKLEEIVTLASIIERETRKNEERPIVAGILLNRLNIGMALQADAATQYAVANLECKVQSQNCQSWWPILTKEDLQVDSPYNTYRFRGLPPNPISNPGLSSLEAVINPEETDYLYYLHDPDGNIHYAKTLAEHNANVRRYLGN